MPDDKSELATRSQTLQKHHDVLVAELCRRHHLLPAGDLKSSQATIHSIKYSLTK